MDQNLNYKSSIKDRLFSLFSKNKKKILSIIIIAIIVSVIFLLLKEKERREDIKLSENYIKAGLFLFSAATLSNFLCYELFKEFENNKYIKNNFSI